MDFCLWVFIFFFLFFDGSVLARVSVLFDSADSRPQGLISRGSLDFVFAKGREGEEKETKQNKAHVLVRTRDEGVVKTEL